MIEYSTMKTLPYTLKSFHYLAEQEARKGDDPTRWDPKVEKHIKELKILREGYHLERQMFHDDDNKLVELRRDYISTRARRRALRDESVQSTIRLAVDMLEDKLKTKTFFWNLTRGPVIDSRVTFKPQKSLWQHLTGKQAEAAIRHEANLSPLSRNSIIRSLKDTLDKQYAHAIIRLDIKSYFDSIPHDNLSKMIAQNRRIDPTTKYLVEMLLQEYRDLTKSQQGLPQGVGLSSQLAEMYLTGFDKEIRSQPGVLYYARYVDDIIIVTETSQDANTIEKEISAQLIQLGLERNDSKSYQIIVNTKGEYPSGTTLEYLGYCFNRPIGSSKLITSLVEKRIMRRTDRMDRAFEIWNQKSPNPQTPNTGNDGLLVNRIQYLASNTKLRNSKSNVAVGIFYSNSALDQESPQLTKLDNHLTELIKNHRTHMSNSLINKLESISFVNGFRNRTFLRFNQQRVERISICWREIS